MAFFRTKKALFRAGEYLLRKKYLSRKQGARFSGQEETARFLSSWNKGLLLDGIKGRLSLRESFQNVCLISKPGIGKTTMGVIPPILDLAIRESSMVINDPKGELWSTCSGYLRANGYNIVVFNPTDIYNSNLFNPLTEARTQTELEQVAETLIWAGNPNDRDPYWNNGATRVLSVLIKCLSFGDDKYNNLPNLYKLIQNFGDMGAGIEDWVLNNCVDPDHPDDDSVFDEWKGLFVGNEEAIQSFVGVCLTALKFLTNRDIKTFFSESDYDLSRIRKEKTAIFFITPAKEEKYYAPLVSIFFKSIFNEAMRQEHQAGKTLPIFVIYDEFGNSYIPNFQSIVNVSRGYRISILIILQTISQIDMRYGREAGEVIKAGFSTMMCLSATDHNTSKHFSDLAGRVVEHSRNKWDDIPTRRTEYNLINPSEIRTMQDDEALIISKNRQPVKLRVRPYYKSFLFSRVAKFPPVIDKVRQKDKAVEYIKL